MQSERGLRVDVGHLGQRDLERLRRRKRRVVAPDSPVMDEQLAVGRPGFPLVDRSRPAALAAATTVRRQTTFVIVGTEVERDPAAAAAAAVHPFAIATIRGHSARTGNRSGRHPQAAARATTGIVDRRIHPVDRQPPVHGENPIDNEADRATPRNAVATAACAALAAPHHRLEARTIVPSGNRAAGCRASEPAMATTRPGPVADLTRTRPTVSTHRITPPVTGDRAPRRDQCVVEDVQVQVGLANELDQRRVGADLEVAQGEGLDGISVGLALDDQLESLGRRQRGVIAPDIAVVDLQLTERGSRFPLVDRSRPAALAAATAVRRETPCVLHRVVVEGDATAAAAAAVEPFPGAAVDRDAALAGQLADGEPETSSGAAAGVVDGRVQAVGRELPVHDKRSHHHHPDHAAAGRAIPIAAGAALASQRNGRQQRAVMPASVDARGAMPSHAAVPTSRSSPVFLSAHPGASIHEDRVAFAIGDQLRAFRDHHVPRDPKLEVGLPGLVGKQRIPGQIKPGK